MARITIEIEDETMEWLEAASRDGETTPEEIVQHIVWDEYMKANPA